MNSCIYYWRGLSEVSGELLPSLRALGLTVHEKVSLEQILDDAPADDPTAIVVDASGGDREASERVLELRSAFQLQMLPIVFISVQATVRCEPLARSYQALVPADLPLKNESLVRAIDLLVKHPENSADVAEFLRALSGSSWPAIQTEVTSGSETALLVLPGDPQPPAEAEVEPLPQVESAAADAETDAEIQVKDPEASPAVAPIGSRSSKLREAVRWVLEDQNQKIASRIHNLSNPKNLASGYGGLVFSLAREASHFETSVLLPTERYGDKIAEHLARQNAKDPWVAAQSHRTAFTSAVIANALEFESRLDAQLRLSALFLNWGLIRAPLEVCCYDLIRHPSKDLRHMICCGFEESAEFLDQTFGSGAGSLIQEMLEVFNGERVLIAAERRRAAEILIGVEFAARACWGKGHWDPQGANRAIRYFRRTKSVFSDREVSKALCRMLGEAVTSHITVHNTFVVPPKDREDRPASAKTSGKGKTARRPEQSVDPNDRWTQKVRICDIAPGMLLSAPVVARDGRVVVGANVRLNEEIVLDLWQLAAVRALGSSVHIAICPL